MKSPFEAPDFHGAITPGSDQAAWIIEKSKVWSVRAIAAYAKEHRKGNLDRLLIANVLKDI